MGTIKSKLPRMLGAIQVAKYALLEFWGRGESGRYRPPMMNWPDNKISNKFLPRSD
jgi:hypothetical protein